MDALDVAREQSELDGKKAQKRESMALEGYVAGIAYQMRLEHEGIYEGKDAEEVRKLFRNWCAWVHAMRGQTGELFEPIARANRMVEGVLEGTLAH